MCSFIFPWHILYLPKVQIFFVPDELPKCGFPGLPSNSIIFPADQSQFSTGDIVQYQCEEGWIMLGPNTRVCQSGQWSGSPPVCSKYWSIWLWHLFTVVFTSFMNEFRKNQMKTINHYSKCFLFLEKFLHLNGIVGFVWLDKNDILQTTGKILVKFV